jgi:hypothetical protein
MCTVLVKHCIEVRCCCNLGLQDLYRHVPIHALMVKHCSRTCAVAGSARSPESIFSSSALNCSLVSSSVSSTVCMGLLTPLPLAPASARCSRPPNLRHKAAHITY